MKYHSRLPDILDEEIKFPVYYDSNSQISCDVEAKVSGYLEPGLPSLDTFMEQWFIPVGD